MGGTVSTLINKQDEVIEEMPDYRTTEEELYVETQEPTQENEFKYKPIQQKRMPFNSSSKRLFDLSVKNQVPGPGKYYKQNENPTVLNKKPVPFNASADRELLEAP